MCPDTLANLNRKHEKWRKKWKRKSNELANSLKCILHMHVLYTYYVCLRLSVCVMCITVFFFWFSYINELLMPKHYNKKIPTKHTNIQNVCINSSMQFILVCFTGILSGTPCRPRASRFLDHVFYVEYVAFIITLYVPFIIFSIV